ncbi:hypothetical protein TRIATDRAFT_301309 [Trichoderma atroviride IMI 206040]|uniref:Uncharacterized protein n=1 Tax=Hypocrea atroviridis (strain ATCC 20476 / IMI 206040) TaxID=452589 RepID=G9P2K3_HYPAI|nr:uncharacterized protein TRIATDRAFT_301309 [Trichoderma atroviride IMI 206040]EHK43521.1 hypothetical protein TRIATDRAFT_301309 [Trichoderma atroviride IMI 206040]
MGHLDIGYPSTGVATLEYRNLRSSQYLFMCFQSIVKLLLLYFFNIKQINSNGNFATDLSESKAQYALESFDSLLVVSNKELTSGLETVL